MEQKSGTVKWVILAIVICMFGSCGACFVWIANSPEGGVRAANQIEPYARDYIEQKRILVRDESIVSYYDGSMSMDASLSIILTNARVIYHKDGRTTAFRLDDVAAMDWRDEGLIGTVIELRSKGGELMRFEIAPLNGGEIFVRDLERALERARSKADPEAPADPLEPADPAPPVAPTHDKKSLHEKQ